MVFARWTSVGRAVVGVEEFEETSASLSSIVSEWISSAEVNFRVSSVRSAIAACHELVRDSL